MSTRVISPRTSVWLDILRGGAAQAVLLGHAYQLFFFGNHAGPESKITMTVHSLIIYLSKWSHDAVIVFFVLSGYLVGGRAIEALRAKVFEWPKYLIARLSRLWTVLIPCLILTFILDRISVSLGAGEYVISNWSSLFLPGWIANGDAWSISRFLGNAFFVVNFLVPQYGTNISLWSLANEFWYYALLPALALLPFGSAKQRGLALAVIAIFVLILTRVSPIVTLYFLFGFCIWLLGAGAYFIRPSPTASAAALLIGASALVCADLVAPDIGTYLRDFLTGLITACVIVLSVNLPTLGLRRPAKFIAGFSYSLYVMHLPVLVLLFAFDPLTAINKPYNSHDLMRLMAYLAITNVCCIAFWWSFELRTDSVRKIVQRLCSVVFATVAQSGATGGVNFSPSHSHPISGEASPTKTQIKEG
jgi:peptidoglycan/LPS O-acetylase OafA/YrhL